MSIESDIKTLASNADKALDKYTALAKTNSLKIYEAKKNETTTTLNCEFFSMVKLDFPLYFSDPKSEGSAAIMESLVIARILETYDKILRDTIVKQNSNPIQHSESGLLVPLLDVCNAMPVSEIKGIATKSKKRIDITSMFFEIKNKATHIKSIQKSLDRYNSIFGGAFTYKSYSPPSSESAMFETGESQYCIEKLIKSIICRPMLIVDSSPLFFETLSKKQIQSDNTLQADYIYEACLTKLFYKKEVLDKGTIGEGSEYDFVKLDGDLSVRAITEVSQNSASIFIADKISCSDTKYSERTWSGYILPIVAKYHISSRQLQANYDDIYIYL